MSGGSKSTTTGYWYHMGLHLVACMGPVDALLQFIAGDRIAWSGQQTTSGPIRINEPELFGGEDREGGIDGTLEVLMGGPTQTASAYLTSAQGSPQPAYRGVLSLVFQQGKVSANNPYVKAWHFRVRRILKGWADDTPWYPETAPIKVAVSTPQPLVWKYRIENQGSTANYSSPAIDDSAWDYGEGPFGNQEWPSGGPADYGMPTVPKVFVPQQKTLWLRSTLHFDSAPSSVLFQAYIDNNAQVFVNGTQVINDTNGYGHYLNTTIAGGYFNVGTNHIAVKLTDDGAGVRPNNWFWFDSRLRSESATVAMNPAHIVYQCLTDPEWGMGYSPAIIDDDSFRAAADTFYAEGLGLCLHWTQQEAIEAFIQRVLDHAGAVMRQDPRTGLFILKPIRDDYVIDDLPLFDEASILDVESFQRAAPTDAVNEITVRYIEAEGASQASVTVQNLANIAAQGDTVAQTTDYPGLPTAELATRIAMRDLRAKSSPVARVRLIVNRSAYVVLPGDVIRWAWPKLGIASMVLRVVRVNTGTLTEGRITIEAVEDVFGLDDATYLAQPSATWEDPAGQAPAKAVDRVVTEAPLYELQRQLSKAEYAALAPDEGYLFAAAARPAGTDRFDLTTRPGGSAASFTRAGAGDFCPSGKLAAALTPAATSATLTEAQDLGLVSAGTYAIIDREVVRVDSIDASSGAITLGRGVLDTVAAAHAAGATVYFADGRGTTDGIEHIDGEALEVRLQTKNASGTLQIELAPTDTVTFDQRHYRPYPPGRLRIAAQAYPTALSGTTPSVTWAHRNRLLQNLEGDESGNIGPEAGVTYTVEYRHGTTDALLLAASGITGTSYTPTTPPLGTFPLKVKLWAVRGGLASTQQHSWTIDGYTLLTPPLSITATATLVAGAATLRDQQIAGQQPRLIAASASGWLATTTTTQNPGGPNARIVVTNHLSSNPGGAYERAGLGAFTTWPTQCTAVFGGYFINVPGGGSTTTVVVGRADGSTQPETISASIADTGWSVYADASRLLMIAGAGKVYAADSVYGPWTLLGTLTSAGAAFPSAVGAGGTTQVRLHKSGSRWFLCFMIGGSASAPYRWYRTDSADPTTGWVECADLTFSAPTAYTFDELIKAGGSLYIVTDSLTGYPQIWRSDNNGTSWTFEQAFTSTAGARCKGVLVSGAGGSTDEIRVFLGDGNTYRRQIGGTAWTSTPNNGLAGREVFCLTYGGKAAATVYPIGGSTDDQRIYAENDGVFTLAAKPYKDPSVIDAPGVVFWSSARLAMANDPLFTSGVVLLLHFDGVAASTVFTDSSPKGRAVQAFGAAALSATQSRFGGTSLALNGTNAYARATASSDFDFGTGDFTVEAWFYASSIASTPHILQLGTALTARIAVFMSGGKISLFTANGSGTEGTRVISADTVTTATWHHLAICRRLGAISLFYDGSLIGTYIGTVYPAGSLELAIGVQQFSPVAGDYFNGFIDEVRVTKGTARYLGTFDPAATNYSGFTQTLYIAANGSHGSSTFTDSSPQAAAITAFGNAQISTAQSIAGGASMLLDGSGDYLTLAYSTANFDWFQSDFTIEAWIRPNALPANACIVGNFSPTANSNNWAFGPDSSGALVFYYWNGATNFVGSAAGLITTGTWHHIAMVLQGTTIKLFINGRPVASATRSGTPQSSAALPLTIGQINNAGFNGYIDDLRLIKGAAAYTGNTTPPGAVFPGHITALLLRGNGADGTTAIEDSGELGLTLSAFNSARNSTAQSKFGGASIAMPTNRSYISVPASGGLAMGTGDFTVEAWVYITSLSAGFSMRVMRWNDSTTGTGATDHTFEVISSGLTFYAGGSASGGSTTTWAATVAESAWYHVALTRRDGTMMAFLNGTPLSVSAGSAINRTNITSTVAAAIGSSAQASITCSTGYIDDLRVVKGAAIYTGAFTPPAAQLAQF